MIPPSNGPSLNQLKWFYTNQMMPRGTRKSPPKFGELDKSLVADIRHQYRSGNLTNNELGQMTNKVEEQNARAFLQSLSTNPASRDLQVQLAAEGISLTDESDVGPGKRFDSVEAKAEYISDKYTYTIRTILPSIVAFGWGFVSPGDSTFQDQKRDYNTPSQRGALNVNVPKSSGGTSSAVPASVNPNGSGQRVSEAIRRIVNFGLVRAD